MLTLCAGIAAHIMGLDNAHGALSHYGVGIRQCSHYGAGD